MSWSDSLNNGLGITMLQSVAVEPSNRYIFAGAELNGAIYLDSTLVSQQDPLAWFPRSRLRGPVAIDPVIPATSSAENVFFDEGPNTFARYSRTTYPLNFNNQRNALPGATLTILLIHRQVLTPRRSLLPSQRIPIIRIVSCMAPIEFGSHVQLTARSLAMPQ